MPEPDQTDAGDRALLAELRTDGRATFSELGQRLGLSAPAIKRRMEKLEARGVITGYTAVIDDAKLGYPIEAFSELRFAGDADVTRIPAIATGIEEVRGVYTIAGDPDALVHIRARDLAHLTQVIGRLRRNGPVTGTKSLMVLGTWTSADGPPAVSE
jgi:DNA-binding Lrp family transcriptional regulator